MKAVLITAPGVVEVKDIPMPVRSAYECLVEVKACGICSSTDLKLIHRDHPEHPLHPFRYPAILGHEAVGEIVELGPKVRNFKLGDRVLIPFSNCGHIPDDRIDAKYGAMTEFSVATDLIAMREDRAGGTDADPGMDPMDFPCQVFPDDISYLDGAMILSFKESYSAIRNCALSEGMDVLIIGDGSVGMGLAHFVNPYGVRSNIVVGHHDDRLAKVAAVAKPSLTLNAKKGGLERIKDMKFDVILDAVGSNEIVRQWVKQLKPGGKLVVIGVLPKDKADISLHDLPNFTSVVKHSSPYREHRAHGEVVALMRSGFIRASDYYSHVMPIDDAAEGIRLLEAREAYKVILTMNGYTA